MSQEPGPATPRCTNPQRATPRRDPRPVSPWHAPLVATLSASLLAACGAGAGSGPVEVVDRGGSGATTFRGEVWADNWFALHVNDRLVVEDSVPITTERSFNAEAFTFNADYPLQLAILARDFKQDDTGLEYIGRGNQQMGDGGFIAQFTDTTSGATVAVTDDAWRCLVVHEAPLDKACEDESDPQPGVGPCGFVDTPEPEGWRSADFDDSGWPAAIEHAASAVRPKGGYDAIDWSGDAELIWSDDLETHNTLLCRLTVQAP